jgi:hypothetical protein
MMMHIRASNHVAMVQLPLCSITAVAWAPHAAYVQHVPLRSIPTACTSTAWL